MDKGERNFFKEILSYSNTEAKLESPERLVLILEMDSYEISYLVVNPEKKQLNELKVFKLTKFSSVVDEVYLSQFFNFFQNDILRNWKRVLVNYVSEKSTLVPSAYYSEEEKDRFFFFNHAVSTSEKMVLADYVPAIDSYLLYSIDQKIKEFISKKFPGSISKSTSTVFVSSVLHEMLNKGKYVAIHIRDSYLDVLLYNNGLKFYNSFQYQGIDDFIYFLLASSEQFKFNPNECEVFVSGNCDVHSDLMDYVRKYFMKLTFAVTEKNIQRDGEKLELASHFYYTLFTRINCE